MKTVVLGWADEQTFAVEEIVPKCEAVERWRQKQEKISLRE